MTATIRERLRELAERHVPVTLPRGDTRERTRWQGCALDEQQWPCAESRAFAELDTELDTLERRATAAEAALRECLIRWKRLDQPDKPASVVEQWADWWIDTELPARSL